MRGHTPLRAPAAGTRLSRVRLQSRLQSSSSNRSPAAPFAVGAAGIPAAGCPASGWVVSAAPTRDVSEEEREGRQGGHPLQPARIIQEREVPGVARLRHGATAGAEGVRGAASDRRADRGRSSSAPCERIAGSDGFPGFRCSNQRTGWMGEWPVGSFSRMMRPCGRQPNGAAPYVRALRQRRRPEAS